MLTFLVRRLWQYPLILAIIYVATFLLAWVAPGSPFDRGERPITPEAEAQLREKFHADTALGFLTFYPLRLAQGDFGPSFASDTQTVGEIIWKRLPISMTLGLLAVVIALFAGLAIGTFAAVRRGGILDALSTAVALAGVSVPSFVVAAALLTVFGFWLGWLPFSQWDWRLGQMVLPAVALSLLPMAYVTRLTRVSMIDTLSADYVPHRPRQGVVAVQGHHQARPAQRRAAGAELHRPRPRRGRWSAASWSKRSSKSPAWAASSSRACRTATSR